MKNRILFISLAVVLALSVGLIGCDAQPAPSQTIVVGMSRPLTRHLAALHDFGLGAIYPIYFQRLNDANGILVDGLYFNVEADVRDDESNPTTMLGHMIDLISDIETGDVHFLWSSPYPPFIDVQATIANAAGVGLMTSESGTTMTKMMKHLLPGLLHPGMNSVFMHSSFADWYQLPILAEMLVEAHQAYYGGNATPTAYICWRDDEHGLEYLAAAAAYFSNAGINIIGSMPVLWTDPAFNPDYIVDAMNATSPDIVCLFCYPGALYPIIQAAINRGFNADAWVTSIGGNVGVFGSDTPQGFGDAAEGVICFATANNKTSPEMANLFNNILTPELGFEYLDFWGHPLHWAALQMWQDAVEAAGQVQGGGFVVDQDNFRNQLASYCDAGSGVATVLGTTWYNMFGANATDGGILDYYCHTGEIGQWQDRYVEIVGYTGIKDDLPNYVVTANFTYPKPDWPPP